MYTIHPPARLAYRCKTHCGDRGETVNHVMIYVTCEKYGVICTFYCSFTNELILAVN